MNNNTNNINPGRDGSYRGQPQHPASGYRPQGQAPRGSYGGRPSYGTQSPKGVQGRRSASPRSYNTGGGNGGGGFDGRKLFFIILIVAVIIIGIIVAAVKSGASRPASVVDSGSESITDTETVPETETADDPSRIKYAVADENTVKLTTQVSSEYVIMIDPEEGRIVAEKNPDQMIYPASMTKIMTLIVAYENCENLYDTFVITKAITDPLYVAGASTAGFETDTPVTVKDLLYGAALPSGGDATDALAIYTAGSIEGFVDMMNKKALSMGLSNTHFVNASGLHDDNHYSTPHEIALILQYALNIPYLREIMSTRYYKADAVNELNPDGIPMYNTMFSRLGSLAETDVARIIAGKTGYTNEGLNCLASVGEVKATGKEYIVVAAKAPGLNDAAADTANLYTILFGTGN